MFDKTDGFFINKEGHGKLLKDYFQVLVAKMGNDADGFKIIVFKKFGCFVGDLKSWLKVQFHKRYEFCWWMFVNSLLCFVHCFVQFLGIVGETGRTYLEISMGVGGHGDVVVTDGISCFCFCSYYYFG